MLSGAGEGRVRNHRLWDGHWSGPTATLFVRSILATARCWKVAVCVFVSLTQFFQRLAPATQRVTKRYSGAENPKFATLSVGAHICHYGIAYRRADALSTSWLFNKSR